MFDELAEVDCARITKRPGRRTGLSLSGLPSGHPSRLKRFIEVALYTGTLDSWRLDIFILALDP